MFGTEPFQFSYNFLTRAITDGGLRVINGKDLAGWVGAADVFAQYLKTHDQPDVWWLSFPSDKDENFWHADRAYQAALSKITSLHTEPSLVDSCDVAKHGAVSNGEGGVDVRYTKQDGPPEYRKPFSGKCAVGVLFLSQDRMRGKTLSGAIGVYEPSNRVVKLPGLEMPPTVLAMVMLHEFWHAYRQEFVSGGSMPPQTIDEEEIWVHKHVFPAFVQWSKGRTIRVFERIDRRTDLVSFPSEALAAITSDDIDSWMSALEIQTSSGPYVISRNVLVPVLWGVYFSYALHWCENHSGVSECDDVMLYHNVSQFMPQ